MRRAFAAALLLLAAGFIALGVWQIERRAWKLELIAEVDARARAAPIAATPRGAAPYTRVTVRGTFDHARATRVQAVTGRGPGDWLLTPLTTSNGWVVLVNRGFVPTSARASAPAGPVAVTGLLRATEPGGTWLRGNDPAADRWYSRDVAAIARRRGLSNVATYFIDAGKSGPGYPLGGLTVIRFRNNHLVYALTWFALAGIGVYGAVRVLRGQ